MRKEQLLIGTTQSPHPAHRVGSPDYAAVHGEMPRFQKKSPALQLTPQERSVLEMLCRYDRVAQVADALFVQPDTVRKHLRHIYEKLGVHSLHRAIVRALELGLIEMPKEPIG
jgi:DNA-binding NarL/FixJ family response regulator